MEPIAKIGFDVPAAAPADPESIPVDAPATFPVEMGPSLMPEDTQGITSAFLIKYVLFYCSCTLFLAFNIQILPCIRYGSYCTHQCLRSERDLLILRQHYNSSSGQDPTLPYVCRDAAAAKPRLGILDLSVEESQSS